MLRFLCLVFASFTFTTTVARADGANSRVNVEGEGRQVRATPDREPRIGPSGPHDPLIINPEKSSYRPFVSEENGELLGTTTRGQFAMPGRMGAPGMPPLFVLKSPLHTKITAMKNNDLTVTTPTGDQTIRVLPGRLPTSGIAVGSEVTITADSKSAIVHLRIATFAPKPYGGIYVGAIQSVMGKTVTLHFLDSTVRTFAASPRILQRIRALVHKTIALQSTDGLTARDLLTSSQLEYVMSSMPKNGARPNVPKIALPKADVRRSADQKSSSAVAPAAVIAAAPSNGTRCWLRKNQAPLGVSENRPLRASERRKFDRALACEEKVAQRIAVAPSRQVVPVARIPATTQLGCRDQDSANIFIALRHWRTQAPVDNAAVNIDGPASINLMSPPSGYIELLNVPAGTYRLRVQKIGVRESGAAVFSVSCNDAVRVQANLHTSPRIVRVVKIHKRELTFRVVDRQKAPMNCSYDRRHGTASGYYTCRVKKVPLWKKTRK